MIARDNKHSFLCWREKIQAVDRTPRRLTSPFRY